MGFGPVETEAGGQAPAEPAQRCEQLASRGPLANLEAARARDLDLDLVSRLEAERLDHRGRQPHRQAVAPLCDLHGASLDIQKDTVYPARCTGKPESLAGGKAFWAVADKCV